MRTQSIFKYYRVYHNETSVIEISANDFKPAAFKRGGRGMNYSLSSVKQKFCDYIDKARAMEQAKAGALVHINKMILDVELAIAKLVKYRTDNYEDLNHNLLDANIHKFKSQMYIK